MEYKNWKIFSDNQNGQNIRLRSGLDYAFESSEEIQKLIEQESDTVKLDSLNFIKNNLKTIYDKFDSALQTNIKLKFIVKDDYEKEFNNYEISDYEILGVEKLECKGRKIAAVEFLFKVNNINFIIEDYFIVSKEYQFRLCELFLSAGLLKRGEPYKMNWDQLIGRKGKCLAMKISEDNYVISRYLEPGVNND